MMEDIAVVSLSEMEILISPSDDTDRFGKAFGKGGDEKRRFMSFRLIKAFNLFK